MSGIMGLTIWFWGGHSGSHAIGDTMKFITLAGCTSALDAGDFVF